METQTQGSEKANRTELFRGYPDVLSMKDLCVLLQIRPNTCRQILKRGEIRSFRIGGHYRIPKLWLIEYIMGNHPAQSD